MSAASIAAVSIEKWAATARPSRMVQRWHLVDVERNAAARSCPRADRPGDVAAHGVSLPWTMVDAEPNADMWATPGDRRLIEIGRLAPRARCTVDRMVEGTRATIEHASGGRHSSAGAGSCRW